VTPATALQGEENMKTERALAMLLVAATFCFPGSVPAADSNVIAQIQQTLESYLAQRHEAEGVSLVSLHIDLGDPGPVIEAYSGADRSRDNMPINGDTLFQIGSNTKNMEAAVLLRLEAEGKLDIGQTVGDWLPEYRAWGHVQIRRLLNMTADIPTYTGTVAIGRIIASDPGHQFTNRELIAAAYPRPGNELPIPSGWFYSNTNNILAALIIKKASGLSLKEQFEKLFKELGLHNTFYTEGRYPDAVLERVAPGFFKNPECLNYQPTPCERSTLAPLLGQDMRLQNLSWAGGAGAVIGNLRDLAKWTRALFGGRVIPPQQLKEMMTLVSQDTGEAVDHATPGHAAFGLDLGQGYGENLGGLFWFYEGSTLGYRVIFAFWPRYNLVMTVATNTQPPEGQDQLAPFVFGKVLHILGAAGIISPSAIPPPGPPQSPSGK